MPSAGVLETARKIAGAGRFDPPMGRFSTSFLSGVGPFPAIKINDMSVVFSPNVDRRVYGIHQEQ
jgi:hypothetical protein